MRKQTWWWMALGLMGPLVTGCGSTADLSCSSDKDCLESEICVPDELMCAQVCITSDLCPKQTPLCEAISDTNTTKVCRVKPT